MAEDIIFPEIGNSRSDKPATRVDDCFKLKRYHTCLEIYNQENFVSKYHLNDYFQCYVPCNLK